MVVGKKRVVLTNTSFDYLHVEIQYMLNENIDIVVDIFPNELPPIRSTSHHINLILGAIFPNKDAYGMTSKENKEIRIQV